jgi:NADPH:quinone reductase-like Zn-dependent oxidoreductase
MEQRDRMNTPPETMIAIDPEQAGGPEVLVTVERPVPRPGPGEVLIAVAAAGVNRPDIMQRLGLYPPPAGAPTIPGLEVAGTIVAVGPEVAPERRRPAGLRARRRRWLRAILYRAAGAVPAGALPR